MRTVLLRHDLREGESHFDWMIQRPPDAATETPSGGPPAPPSPGPALLTFRITCRIDLPPTAAALSVPVEFLAERIPDHRPAYLAYEGEITGGRGRVSRLADGDLRILTLSDERIVLDGTIGEADGTFTGERAGPDLWLFRFKPRT